MKIIKYAALLTAAAAMLCGCGNNTSNDINLAVIGCEETYEEGYLKGIELAVNDAKEKYPNKNITVNYYDDDENYEKGSAIIDQILSDKNITAVIGSQTPTICASAAYSFEAAGITMLAPFTVYDSMMNDNNYKKIFSMCYSQEKIGKMLYQAMQQQNANKKTIALCYCEDQSGKDEARSFAEACSDGNKIVDYVKLHDLQVQFEDIYSRWETLGVDTVVLMPYDTEGFDILKSIKGKNPQMNAIGDFMFDNKEEIESAGSAFNGFMFVAPFYSDDSNTQVISGSEHQEEMGKWAMHGYDAVMMIVNAASESNDIAQYLHDNPYKKYSFNEKGEANADTVTYEVFNNGIAEKHYISFKE